jgi:hypothetical protein
MPILDQLPALLRIALVFILILMGIRMKLFLGHAFLAGAVFLGLLFRMNPAEMIQSIAASAVELKTVLLAVIVGLILVLSSSLEKAGQMSRMLANFRDLIPSQRLKLTIFPALIGLLPMPGGAVFSAPMVKKMGLSFWRLF